MEEHREKILQSRTLKRKVVKLILSVLGQGIRVAEILMRKFGQNSIYCPKILC